MRLQPLLRRMAGEKMKPRRRGIGRGRSPAHQVIDRHQQRVGDRLVLPFVLGVGVAENNIERFVADRVGRHGELRITNERHQTASTAVTSGT